MPQIPTWVPDAVFYQIFPDRFAGSDKIARPNHLEPWDSPPSRRGFKGGNLLGVAEHLDYLEFLGINAIYFNPIFQSPVNHRYHTYDYFQVDPILGGNEAFQTLLAEAHRRGIRVMLDGVFNHASRGFFQFHHILENGPASPYVDWFNVTGYPTRAYESKAPPNYDAWWNMPDLPKFNTEAAAVREFLFQVAEHWLTVGIDGWRLDVPLEIKTPGFWEEFRQRVKRINPEAYILGEIWDNAESWLQGEHFDATMNYPFQRACLGYFGGDLLDTSYHPGGFALRPFDAKAFSQEMERNYQRIPVVALTQYNLLSSHDVPRFITMVRRDKHRLVLASLFQMIYPGTPSIYYGDEIGLEGGPDPGCRGSFPWDETRWDQDLLHQFREMIALRKAHPALRHGTYRTLLAEGSVCVVVRQTLAETIVAAFQAGDEPAQVTLELPELLTPAPMVQTIWGPSASIENGFARVKLPPLSACLFSIGQQSS
jgi:neopullulanase